MRWMIFLVVMMTTFELFAQNDTVRFRRCRHGCERNGEKQDPPGTAFEYGEIQNFLTEDVLSDYGVRNVSGRGSRFHQAIDYSSVLFGAGDNDKGDAIVAIQGGTVYSIWAQNNYKGIRIGNYEYTHIFLSGSGNQQHQRSGKFVLKK